MTCLFLVVGSVSIVVEGVATCGVKSDNDREHCQDPVIVVEQPRVQ